MALGKPLGRPTDYTPELADYICKIVSTHTEGIRKLCKKFDRMPDPDTIFLWRLKHKTFSEQYLEAKRFQSEIMVEEIDDIIMDVSYYVDDKGRERIDPPSASLSIAKANNRKWTASRLAPKIWGDKRELEQAQAENSEIKAELMELRAKLAEQNRAEY